MTLDEAIKHAREVAEENREEAMNAFFPPYADECESCAEEHEKLASWLEELKELREFKAIYQKGMDYSYATFMYNKAIDDLARKISKYRTYDDWGNVINVLKIAEELKKRCAE